MFRASAARRGLLRAWKRPTGFLVSRGFLIEATAAPYQWNFDDTVPGFKDVWSKIESGHPKAKPVEAVAEWKNAGNEVTKELVNNILYELCDRNWFGPANRLAKWLDSQNFQLTEEEQLTRLHIASNLKNTEKKLTELSKTFQHKDEGTFLTFLRIYVSGLKRGSAEKLFKELKESKLMVTAHAYTLLLDMYLHLEYESEVVRVVNEYEASGLPPDPVMHWLLLKNKEVVSTLPVEEKARAALETLETTTANRRDMMKLHAYLGHAEEVDRIWEQMLANPPILGSEYLAALESYDCIGNLTKAEEVSEKYKVLLLTDGACHNYDLAMLRLYARHGKMDKALKIKAERMAHKAHFGQAHPIVEGYLKQGDLQQAVEFCRTHLALKDQVHIPWKLVADSIVKLNKEFALTGDVKSAEKMMALVPGLKYVRVYKSLMKVYLSAKTPSYGLRERMRSVGVALDDEAEDLLKQLAALEAGNAGSNTELKAATEGAEEGAA